MCRQARGTNTQGGESLCKPPAESGPATRCWARRWRLHTLGGLLVTANVYENPDIVLLCKTRELRVLKAGRVAQ